MDLIFVGLSCILSLYFILESFESDSRPVTVTSAGRSPLNQSEILSGTKSQYGITQEMMTMSSLTPSSNINTMHIEEMMTMSSLTPNNIKNTMQNEGILSSA
ncbi:hypothetical protein L1987_39381 [Smallanthus sonchifolius]|uniref:Uncharacterized protein n=1 Tax=Smallanthus sonchifolius TaxID=185202 RepID=A0ACB9HLN1_9ASTR|nr:hypothetical protein L1987_39381 [Smallanthus sonchifolius]